MAKILISPSKYLQGAGEMKNIGTYAAKCGKKALVLISQGGYRRIGTMIEESFAGSDCNVVFDYFNGECCESEINRLVAIVKEKGCDLVIGVGGGKIFDTAKAVAYYAEKPVFICPTIASTDAPCSALSVVYTEEGVFEKYLFLPANPNLVLMDTDIIVKSPVRLTVAGMGDALATYFEARACQRSGATSCAGGKTTEAAMALAKLCFDTLMEEGVKAKIALEAGVCTPAVEKVIEANTLLSGIGFESAGLAGAHAIHNGFTVLEECHHMYHGEKVAFGTLTQLVLENVPLDELEDIILWCIEVGLPVTFQDEMNYIQNYVELMNLRYDFTITLSVQIPENLYRQDIPKMSLQPIVENAITHGIEELDADAVIEIKGIEHEKSFEIEITDSGIGMSEKQLAILRRKLRMRLNSDTQPKHGIGLRNVQDRIHIQFGTEYGLSVYTKEHCYTKVSIHLPITRGKYSLMDQEGDEKEEEKENEYTAGCRR